MLNHEFTSLEKEIVSLWSLSAQQLSSSLAVERVTFSEEVADMAEARKAFQMEKDPIRQEMDAYRREWTEHWMDA
ncbi:unnamed protein product [Lota lota]